jgi:branched-chain amino acid transport system permease protein
MTEFLQAIFSGASTGAIYALLAMGFAFLYAVGRYPNFAQGDWALFSGMAAAAALGHGWPLALVAVVAPVTGAALAVVTQFVLRLSRSGDVLTAALILLALGLVIEGAAQRIWGTNPQFIPSFVALRPIRASGAVLTMLGVITIVVTVGVVLALTAFLRFTRTGRVLGAWSENAEAAALAGINVKVVLIFAFAVSGALAGVAGFFFTAQNGSDYLAGLPLTLKAFGAAALGGLRRPLYAVGGGFALGWIESFFQTYGNGADAQLASLLFLMVAVIALARARGADHGQALTSVAVDRVNL